MVKKFFIGLFCLLWVTSVGAQAPTVAIDSPHTVSLLRGLISVEGTVDVPELQLFWLQVRALNETLEPIVDGSGGWMPITLPQSGVIVNGVLGQWDTMRVEDGLYELQLIAFPISGTPLEMTLSPLRVENEKVAYLGGQHFNDPNTLLVSTSPTDVPLVTLVAPTLAPLVAVAPTVATGGSCNPTATAAVNANVRTGDSTAYSVVGTLPRGQQAPIIGRSSRSAWYVIRLSNGTQGFISPTTISIVGDVTCAPFTEPPALAFTSTPVPPSAPTAPAVVTLAPTSNPMTTVIPTVTPNIVPTAMPTVSLPSLIPTLGTGGILIPAILPTLALYPDLQLSNYTIMFPPSFCGQGFYIRVSIDNFGVARSEATELVVRNYRTTTSTNIWGRSYSIPALDSGNSFEVQPFLEINEGANEFHLIEFAIDPHNLVVESNEANNLNHTISYFLEPNPGVCP